MEHVGVVEAGCVAEAMRGGWGVAIAIVRWLTVIARLVPDAPDEAHEGDQTDDRGAPHPRPGLQLPCRGNSAFVQASEGCAPMWSVVPGARDCRLPQADHGRSATSMQRTLSR